MPKIIGQQGQDKQERDIRDIVYRRSVEAGEWLDEFTTVPKTLRDLPKCLTRDKDGKVAIKTDYKKQ